MSKWIKIGLTDRHEWDIYVQFKLGLEIRQIRHHSSPNFESRNFPEFSNFGGRFELNSPGMSDTMKHSVVKFQSWALFTNFKSKNFNEVGRDLREDCCE